MKTIHKAGRCLLGGRILTNIGDSILYMLVIWHFNETFSSPFLLSAAFAAVSVVDACSVLLGPFIDRNGPKQNLFWMSLIQELCVGAVFVITVFVRPDSLKYGMILLSALFLTYIGSSIIYPSGEKLIPLFAGEDELVQMNSLFHVSEKILDIAFNAVSTIIISFFEIHFTMILILLLFGAAARFHRLVSYYVENQNTALTPEHKNGYSISGYLMDLKKGIAEIRNHSNVTALFVPLSVLNMFYGAAVVGLPKLAELYISEKAYGYGGLLMSSSMGGILGASLICKFSGSISKPRRYTSIFLLAAGTAWLLIPITMPISFWLSYLFIFISNCAVNMMNVMFVSVVQKEIDHALLGRVSTFTESLVSVVIPVGNAAGGIMLTAGRLFMPQFLYGAALLLCAASFGRGVFFKKE